MCSLQNRFDLREEKKVTQGQIGEIWGLFQSCNVSFCEKVDEYLGVCEQENYYDGTPMCGLPKGSASCHALILQGAEESFFISNFYCKAKQ